MTRSLAMLMLSGFSMLSAACATREYVRQQVTATETKLTDRVETQDTKLRETADRAAASRQAVDATAQRVEGLDARVGELNTTAKDAQSRAGDAQSRAGDALGRAGEAQSHADQAAGLARDSEARLSQRIADRNKYRLLDTRFIYFETGRAEIRDAGVSELQELAKALQADPNALVEVQGFADPRGTDRYNDELARERVDAVVRHLVRQHGVELRQIRSAAMGKATLAAGEKPSGEVLANARRVEMRLLTPWSSWEDTQAGGDDRGSWPSASPANLPPANPPPANR